MAIVNKDTVLVDKLKNVYVVRDKQLKDYGNLYFLIENITSRHNNSIEWIKQKNLPEYLIINNKISKAKCMIYKFLKFNKKELFDIANSI